VQQVWGPRKGWPDDSDKWLYSVGERVFFYFVSKPLPVVDTNVHHSVQELIEFADAGFEAEVKRGTCPCCEKTLHYNGTPQRFSAFYFLTGDSYRATYRRQQLQALLNRHSRCQCSHGEKEGVLYDLPCASRTSVVFRVAGVQLATRGQYDRKRKEMRETSQTHSAITRVFKVQTDVAESEGCHIVPLQAGGCPTAAFGAPGKTHYNVVPINAMCPLCQHLDELFTKWQSEDTNEHRGESSYDEHHYANVHPMQEAETTTTISDAVPRPVSEADIERSSTPLVSHDDADAASAEEVCRECGRIVQLPIECENEKTCPYLVWDHSSEARTRCAGRRLWMLAYDGQRALAASAGRRARSL
jgi:hypothetical protein